MSITSNTADESDCVFIEMIFPERANHYGTLYGSNGLEMLGRAAFVAASRHARKFIVMAAADKIEFHSPVPVGSLLESSATVIRTGRT